MPSPSPTTWVALDAAEPGLLPGQAPNRGEGNAYSSEIEPAILLGRHVARRGFWGAEASRRLPAEAVDAWEHASARPRIAVWCRLGIATDKRNSEPRTIPAQKFADSASDC